MSQSQNNGIMNLPSRYSVERIVERLFNLTLLEVLRRKGQIDAVLIEKPSIKEKRLPWRWGSLFLVRNSNLFAKLTKYTQPYTGKWAVV